MKTFFTLLLISIFTLPAIASCSIDNSEACTASVLEDNPSLQERIAPNPLDELKKTDAFQPKYIKPYYDELINTTPNNPEYNSNCQFGVCLPGSNNMDSETSE